MTYEIVALSGEWTWLAAMVAGVALVVWNA